jgi:phenylpropionate dioxygenase-like ring-hydroxylating dioxygenase large terminal subunit
MRSGDVQTECEEGDWQFVCDLSELAQVGDWLVHGPPGHSVIVVRVSDNVRAFYNICRHAGTPIVAGRGNCRRQGLTCALHGWRWDMFGQCVAQGAACDPLRRDISLLPCKLMVTHDERIFVDPGPQKPSYLAGH